MAGLCEGGNEPPVSLKATDQNEPRRKIKREADTKYSGRRIGKQLEVSEVRSIDKTNGENAREDMIRTGEGTKRLPDISDCEDRIDTALERLLAKKKSAKKESFDSITVSAVYRKKTPISIFALDAEINGDTQSTGTGDEMETVPRSFTLTVSDPPRDSNTLPAREQVARESTRAPRSTGETARGGEERLSRPCFGRVARASGACGEKKGERAIAARGEGSGLSRSCGVKGRNSCRCVQIRSFFPADPDNRLLQVLIKFSSVISKLFLGS
ncbi:hypothetical protein ANN_16373 [Periplaneta americana]|uniref:Uncharacterized protein n=1 Tax=Periplaneta americana TaxID=6978 RepID=A0ABQ8SIT9_PERAM|nr:hypothetical protein ANN_16373 [Periplaneta americana]